MIFGKHVGGMQRNCTTTLERQSAFATHAQDAAAIILTQACIAFMTEHLTLHCTGTDYSCSPFRH